MLAVGGRAGPVPDGAHGTARQHEGDGGVTSEDGEHRPNDDAENDEPNVEGVPGVCHDAKRRASWVTERVKSTNHRGTQSEDQ